MSASASRRRRSAVVGERNSATELVGGVARDLSDSIREAVIERSLDLVQNKKALPNSTTTATAAAALPCRNTATRKGGVSKSEKPPWQTAISVLTKNSLVLLILLGFVQLIYKLALNPVDTSTSHSSDLGKSDFENRIAELESFVKRTTQLVQFQVDVVDHKIDNEIGGLRREVSKKIDEKGMEFANELKELETRTESFEKYLGELSEKDWLTKEDLNKFIGKFEKAKGIVTGGRDVNLDEIRAFAKEIVEKELEKRAADGLGRVDYALVSGGAMVVKHSDPLVVLKGNGRFYRNGVNIDAAKMISPSFGEPGQCFPLKGNSGFVQIRLRTAIIPEAITLEHVAKTVAYDRSSAPKDCRVYGWLQGDDATDLAANAEKIHLLTEFTYDLEKSSAQTFNVLDSARSGGGIINMVRLDFSTNHGSPSHTCIYRLRVHGHETNSDSVLAMQS